MGRTAQPETSSEFCTPLLRSLPEQNNLPSASKALDHLEPLFGFQIFPQLKIKGKHQEKAEHYIRKCVCISLTKIMKIIVFTKVHFSKIMFLGY